VGNSIWLKLLASEYAMFISAIDCDRHSLCVISCIFMKYEMICFRIFCLLLTICGSNLFTGKYRSMMQKYIRIQVRNVTLSFQIYITSDYK